MTDIEKLKFIALTGDCVGIKCSECPIYIDCIESDTPFSEILANLRGKLANLEKPPITNTNYQPAPKTGGQIVYTELIKDIEARAEFGRSKYGQDLCTEDGRDTLVDAYQEALDLCMYLKKMLMEREDDGK